MRAECVRRAPLALGGAAAVFAVLAFLDKFYGLVQRPLALATLAYACLFLLLLSLCRRGPRRGRASGRLGLSLYAAVLLLNALTGIYVLAWRVSADPTPIVLQSELDRGDALLKAGDNDAAHLLYRQAHRRFPNSFPVLMRLGAVNYRIGDFDRAKRYFERALEVAPAESRWQALNDLAQTFWRLQRAEEAVHLYLRAEEAGIPPAERVDWHYRIAWAYFDVKDYDAAVRHYIEVARAGGPFRSASYYNAACAQAQKLRLARDPAERERLVEEAVENLRRAWRSSTDEEDRDALRKGLLGPPEERDPELAPLRGTAPLRELLREIRPSG